MLQRITVPLFPRGGGCVRYLARDNLTRDNREADEGMLRVMDTEEEAARDGDYVINLIDIFIACGI